MARVRLDPRTPFGPLGYQTWFGVRATATCSSNSRYIVGMGAGLNRLHDRIIPDPTCSCGFYSVTADHHYPVRAEASQFVRLDVQLAGRVLVCQTGYRAEWQQVLGMRVPACPCGARRDLIWRGESGLILGHGECVNRQNRRLVRRDYDVGYPDDLPKPSDKTVSEDLLRMMMPVAVTLEGRTSDATG